MGTNKDNFSELDPAYQGKGLKFGIVMSRFNRDICEGLLSACEAELLRLGVARNDVLLVRSNIRWRCRSWHCPRSTMRSSHSVQWYAATPTILKSCRTNRRAAFSTSS